MSNTNTPSLFATTTVATQDETSMGEWLQDKASSLVVSTQEQLNDVAALAEGLIRLAVINQPKMRANAKQRADAILSKYMR